MPLQHACAPDFLFQPIAEDESGLDEIAGEEWRALPTFMEESCHLRGVANEESRSPPPPPAPLDPDVGHRNRRCSESNNSDKMDTMSPT